MPIPVPAFPLYILTMITDSQLARLPVLREMLVNIVKSCFQEQQKAEGYIKLKCGFATIPLLDVPFHSQYLWAGVLPLRACMLTFFHDEFPFELIILFQIFPRKSI